MNSFVLYHGAGCHAPAAVGNPVGNFGTLSEAQHFAEYLERSEEGNWAQVHDPVSRQVLRSGFQQGAASGYWWSWSDVPPNASLK